MHAGVFYYARHVGMAAELALFVSFKGVAELRLLDCAGEPTVAASVAAPGADEAELGLDGSSIDAILQPVVWRGCQPRNLSHQGVSARVGRVPTNSRTSQ
jgi:hypothetical protein